MTPMLKQRRAARLVAIYGVLLPEPFSGLRHYRPYVFSRNGITKR